MITHIPKNKDFEKAGIDILCQSIFFIYQIRKEANEIYPKTYHNIKNNIWIYNQSILRTCLISLFQGIEILMKSEICKNSPFLLIEDKCKDWVTLPDQKDKDFDRLHTISGDSLLAVFFAVQKLISTKKNKNEFIALFEEIRLKRNKAIHGLLKDEISPKYIISSVLKIFILFYTKDKWFHEFLKKFETNPIFDPIDKETKTAQFNEYMDYIEEFIGKSELNRNLTIDVTKRKYYCPKCFDSLSVISDTIISKWAFLDGNNKVKCLICNKTHIVIRKNCVDDECRGNVLYKNYKKNMNLCLTCGELN